MLPHRRAFTSNTWTSTTWKSSIDPVEMLRAVFDRYESDGCRTIARSRKERLFICACARRVWQQFEKYPPIKDCIEFAEKYADGQGAKKRLKRVLERCTKYASTELSQNPELSAMLYIAGCACTPDKQTMGTIGAYRNSCSILRINDDQGDPCAADTIRCIFGNPFSESKQNRRFSSRVKEISKCLSSHKQYEQMPILADALEEDGCEDQEILNHCRTNFHVHGCWVLDHINES